MNKKKANEGFGGFNGQAAGYGKNYHTINPEPISAEAISGIEHFTTALPNGKFLAGISLPDSDEASPAYEFNSEEEASFWIRKMSDRYMIQSSNIES